MRRPGQRPRQWLRDGSGQACASPRASIGIKRDGRQKRTPPLSRRGSKSKRVWFGDVYPRSGAATGGGGGGGGAGGAAQVAVTATTDPSGHVCVSGGGGGRAGGGGGGGADRPPNEPRRMIAHLRS